MRLSNYRIIPGALCAAFLVVATQAIAADTSDPGLTTQVSETSIEVTHPHSKLALVIPKGGLGDLPRGGGSASSRYFGLADPETGLVVSGWFEPASAFKGVKEFWIGEFTAMKNSGMTPIEPPEMVDLPGWIAISYELKLPSAPEAVNTHIRAERIEAGTWIDLHISVTSKEPLVVARGRALEFLKKLEVRKKN